MSIRHKQLVISMIDAAPAAPWSWRLRGVTFALCYGAMWLILQPGCAKVFGVQVLTWTGWWGYLLVALGILWPVNRLEYITKRRRLATMEILEFYIEFVKSGRHLKVQVPRDMQIAAFQVQFIDHIKGLFPEDSSTLHLYTHNLLVKHGAKFRPVNGKLTFREAEIPDGATCRLRGYIRVEYQRPLLVLGYGKELAELIAARAKGFVFMDELDSISQNEALTRGLLSQQVIERVRRFPYPGGFFYVFCPEDDIEDVEGLNERL